MKTNTYAYRGCLETVSWITPRERSRVMRVYDKGRERVERRAASGSDFEAGSWIRIERQLRFAKREQRPPQELQIRDLGWLWLGHLEPLMRGRLVLRSPGDAQRLILAGVRSGAIGALQAERLIGAIAIMAFEGDGWYARQGHQHAGKKRLGDLLSLEVLVDGQGASRDDLDLSGVLSVALQEWASESTAENT